MIEKKKITSQTIIPLILIAIWIMVLNTIIIGFEIPHGWTIFIATIFFFNMGANKKCLPELFIGGLVGLGSAWIFLAAAGLLIPSFGHLGGALVPLTIIVVSLIVLHPFVPVVFNNVAFAYLIISAINLDKVMTDTLSYMIVFIIGGGIAIAGCMIIIKILTDMAMKKKEAVEKSNS